MTNLDTVVINGVAFAYPDFAIWGASTSPGTPVICPDIVNGTGLWDGGRFRVIIARGRRNLVILFAASGILLLSMDILRFVGNLAV